MKKMKKMKKIYILTISSFLMFSCGESSNTEKTDEETPAEKAEKAEIEKKEHAKRERDMRISNIQSELDRRLKFNEALDRAGLSEKERKKRQDEAYNYDIIPKDADSNWYNHQYELWLD